MGNFGLNKETLNAFVGGLIPALLWLFFWMRSEERKDREPIGLIALVFIIGMFSVFVAVALEHIIEPYFSDPRLLIFGWAAIEEFVKYGAIMLIIKNNKHVNDPMDFAIYFIAGALGFAGLENILFLMNPGIVSDANAWMLTGNLRFLGSTLLHAICSCIIGIGVGLSYYQNWRNKFSYIWGGFAAAILLHSLFNLFIINTGEGDFFKIFGFLWVISIISILLLEKLRRLKGQEAL